MSAAWRKRKATRALACLDGSPIPQPRREEYRSRIDDLSTTRATTKFLSLEPLLGPLRNLDLKGIDWVIVGGESGPGARPMDPEWARDLRNQCRRAKVPFFFEQWGGKNKKQAGRVLDGRTWDEMPPEPPEAIARPGRRQLPLAVVR